MVKMGVFTNSGLQIEEKFTRSFPFERLNRVNLSYGVVSSHFSKSRPVSGKFGPVRSN
jgi:hypothetical protein